MGRGRIVSDVGVLGMPPVRSIWSEIIQSGDRIPCTRTRHAAATWGRNIFILGGRRGNIALKDFWQFNIDDKSWEEIEVTGDKPGYLQDHSMVEYEDKLYVFGGEISFCNDQEIPLWIFDTEARTWQRGSSFSGGKAPKSLRGHSATVYNDSMFIFGGYQDLLGSNADVWMFHFPSCSWHLIFRSEPSLVNHFAPTPRHNHTAVLHDSNLWIYGGLNNLQPSSDFVKFDLDWQTWEVVRTKQGPGNLHSHCAGKYGNKMIIIGGRSEGHLSEIIWLFHFETETWEKLSPGVNQPQPRNNIIALTTAWEEHTPDDDVMEEEVSSAGSQAVYKKPDRSLLLTSRLRKAVSQTGLSRQGAYTSLTNLAMDSETSSLSNQVEDREPYCVFNKRSGQAQLHLADDDHNHNMFSTALNTPLIDTQGSDSGVELREGPSIEHTHSPYFSSQATFLVIGGMSEGQVPWNKENLAFWKVKVTNK